MVTEIGITYLRLETADGPMSLSNAQVLAAAVSRRSERRDPIAPPETANSRLPASATPADAPAAPSSDGQQAGPADLGLAGRPQTAPDDVSNTGCGPRSPRL
jgi:hypothetical protein